MLERKAVLLLAFLCAATVGNLYYAQPLLAELGRTFDAGASRVGWVATLAQIGYGLGVLFLVPLGDVLERRSLIVTLLLVVTASLCVAGSAPSLVVLIGIHLVIGFSTVVPQIIVPYAATLAQPAQRAATIGTVQSGLLIGILLARSVSGGIATLLGWRGVFFCAAVLAVTMAAVVRRALPAQVTTSRLRYGELLSSMVTLLGKEPRLRSAALASGLNFASFSAFWTTLAFLLDASFHIGPGGVGLFGIVGVAGALTAPLAGRLSDLRGTEFTRNIALIVTLLSFGVFVLAEHSIALLVFGVVAMDAGVQATHIACQADALSLGDEARSRLNGVYMFLRFSGGAVGSWVGAWAWTAAGWNGVCAVGALCSVGAFLPHLMGRRERRVACTGE